MIEILQIRVLLTWLEHHRLEANRMRREQPDLGADIVQTVIIIGAFAVAALAITAILIKKATASANNVKTQ